MHPGPRRRSRSPSARAPGRDREPEETGPTQAEAIEDAADDGTAAGAQATGKIGEPDRSVALSWLVWFLRAAVGASYVFFGLFASFLSSKSCAWVLSLAPHSRDAWAVRLLSAAMRTAAIGAHVLQFRPSDLGGWAAAVSRMATGVAVEISILFAQPIFATATGGVFQVCRPCHGSPPFYPL